jgi:hypothetical protein
VPIQHCSGIPRLAKAAMRRVAKAASSMRVIALGLRAYGGRPATSPLAVPVLAGL